MTDSVEIPAANPAFLTMTNSIKVNQVIETTKNIGNGKIDAKTSTLPLSVVDRCRNRPGTVSSSSEWSTTPDLPLEFRSHISSFLGHIATSGCRPLLQSLADTFF